MSTRSKSAPTDKQGVSMTDTERTEARRITRLAHLPVRTRTVEIAELVSGDGWRFGNRVYQTACSALGAIRKEDQDLARGGISSVTQIRWYPITAIGRLVVRVIAGSDSSERG